MNQVPPVPLPRSKNSKRDVIPSPTASSPPPSQLPPTPLKRPIPLPRLVGNSRSERNILATLTRRSSNASPSTAVNEERERVGMGHSLEGMQELFRTISFPSPLEEEKLKWESKVPEDPHPPNKNETDLEISGRDTPPSPEPPFYPPPPLPDESVYDEVQSLPGSKSSPWFSVGPRPFSQPNTTKQGSPGDEELVEDNYNSSTNSQYYPCSTSSWTDSLPEDRTESIYEDIIDNLESQSSAGGGSSQTGDCSSGSDNYPFKSKKLSLLRCDSWSFYDSVETRSEQDKVLEKDNGGTEKPGRVKLSSMNESCPEEYENVVIVSPCSTGNSDGGEPFVWGSVSSHPTSTRSSDPPVSSSPSNLFPGRMPLLIPAPAAKGSLPALTTNVSSSHTPDSQTSEAEDGDVLPDTMLNFIRKKDYNFYRPVTHSVILEFDPLFDKTPLKQAVSSPQFNNIGKMFGATAEEPPYGKINKGEPLKEHKEKQIPVESTPKERKSVPAGKIEEKLLTKISRDSSPASPDALSLQSHVQTSNKTVSSETVGNLDVSKCVPSKQNYDVDEGEARILPDQPPPLPRRVDSIEQVVSVEELEGGGVNEAKRDDGGSASSLKFCRSSLRLPSQRWNSMKQQAKRFLNGVTGEKTMSVSSVGQPSETSKDNKFSIFYQQPNDACPVLAKSSESGDESPNSSILHSGMLYQVASGAAGAVGAVAGGAWSGAQLRWFSISNGKLTWWREKGGVGPSSCLPLERLISICVMSDRPNPNADGEILSCFELGVLGGKTSWIGRHGGGSTPPAHSLLLGSVSTSERRQWMQKLLESIVPSSRFPNHAMLDFTRAGCAVIKEGISGKWSKGWLLLYQRTLFYFTAGIATAMEANLQHARCIKVTKEEDGGGPSILVDTQGGCSIYIRPISAEGGSFSLSHSSGGVSKFLGSKCAINGWKSALKTAAVESGPGIAEQQLTLENVPVIVDKCLNFIYAHGGMSEGIYRRSGSNSVVTRLLTAFNRDAWDVQLTRRDYSEYDVASVLKRFFRDLPEPLLTASLHDEFCRVAESDAEKKSEKVSSYRDLLGKLPSINYGTLRRLLAHLNYVHGQRERNLMPVENLAAIWGPTLMHVEGNDSLGWSRRESEVVLDLVSLFASLFDVTPEEEERERKMQEVLERYHQAASGSPASSTPSSPSVPIRSNPESSTAFPGGRMPPSGDLKVWVHILPSLSLGSRCIHVTLSPQRLAGQVAIELCRQLKLNNENREMWGLEEHVLGGALIRPLHPMERVLDAVLRWGYWDELDRRDNFIALAPSTLYAEVAPMAKAPVAVSGDLRFADSRSKSFKTYLFEFTKAKLSYYKDKRGSNKLGEWKVEDILWYLGHEPKRNPQSRWSITFINKHKKVSRSKEAPFFGNTIAGFSSEEMLRWATALLVGEHPEGLFYPLTPDLMY